MNKRLYSRDNQILARTYTDDLV